MKRIKHRKALSLLFVFLLLLEGILTLSATAKTYVDGDGNTIDEATFCPVGVVKDGDSYRKASEGEKGVRYRILRTYSIRQESSDGGRTWSPGGYWKTKADGTVEPCEATVNIELDLPTAYAVDIQTSAYTNLTPWKGLYYPESDNQNIESTDKQLQKLKEDYNREIYSFSANMYSVTPKVISRDEAAGTTRVRVTVQCSLPRDGTVCESYIPETKKNGYQTDPSDIKILSGCSAEKVHADLEARTRYLKYGNEIIRFLKDYNKALWEGDTATAEEIYKSCKEEVNSENFGTLKKRFDDMKATQEAARKYLDANYKKWVEAEYDAINADYSSFMANIESYTHKWFDPWLTEYNAKHPESKYTPTDADMQKTYEDDRTAINQYMTETYGDRFYDGEVHVTKSDYEEFRYKAIKNEMSKINIEYYSYSWNVPFTISYKIGTKCIYCGDMIDADSGDDHCTDDSCSLYKNYDDDCGCCQICSACKIDVVRGYGNTNCAQGCDTYGTDECSCYKPAIPPIDDPYVTKGSSENTNTATSVIHWQERWSHVIYYYSSSGYLRSTTCYHVYKYQAFLDTKVALRNADQSSWSSAFSSLRSGYGFASKMTCTGYITGQDSCMSGSSWRCEGGYKRNPEHTVYMPYGNSASYNTTSNYVICDTTKLGNVSYKLTSGKKATQGTTIQFQSVTDSDTPKFTAVIPSNGSKVTNIYEPVKSSLSTYGYRNIYTPAKLKDGNHHVYFKVYSGGLEYSGLHQFIIDSVDRYISIKGSMYDDTGVVVH